MTTSPATHPEPVTIAPSLPIDNNDGETVATMTNAPSLPSTPAVDEPVTVAFTVRERDGQTIPNLDSMSDLAIAGGYDALRIRTIAKEAKHDDSVATATDMIRTFKPRAVEAARHLVSIAGPRVKDSFKPGGDRKTRAEARAALKAALRAYRLHGA